MFQGVVKMRMKINIKIENKDIINKTFEWEDDLIRLFLEQLDVDLSIYEKHKKWKKEKI